MNKRFIIVTLLALLVILSLCEGRRRRVPSRLKHKISKNTKLKNQKQILYSTRETSTPSFITMLLFRLVYGIASQMGVEDRIPSFLAPPNSEDGDYGFFNFGGSDGPSIFGGGEDDYDF